MSAAWVAGTVRARALAERCAGTAGARELAAGTGLDEALRQPPGTPHRKPAPPLPELVHPTVADATGAGRAS